MKLNVSTSRPTHTLVIPLLALALASVAAAAEQQSTPPAKIHIDIPVALKQAKAVFSVGHAEFTGDLPTGLFHMTNITKAWKEAGTQGNITAIFHGQAGYMLLNDEAYNELRKVKTGNPHKAMIQNLTNQGVAFEMCGVTMKGQKWTNANLLPIAKVNSGALSRVLELSSQGYVMLPY